MVSSPPRAVTLCVISVLVVSIPRAAIPKTASSFHPSLRKESAMAEFGAEIRSRGAVRGAGEMTDAAPIALASGEVAVGRQKWVRRSLWLAGGVGVVSLLAAGYWEELKELNAYGQLYLRAPPPHESVRVRTGESDASTSSHPPSGAPPGAARALASAKRADRRGRPRRCRSSAPSAPALTLEKDGWVAWPPPNPPPGAVAAPSEETSTSESVADTGGARTAERATTSQSTESSSSEDAESPRSPSPPEGAPWDAKVAWPPPNPPPAETKERYVEPATDSSISGTDAAPEPNGGANNARADSPPSLETEGWVAWPPPNPPPPSGP